jgi:putative endonuclease
MAFLATRVIALPNTSKLYLVSALAQSTERALHRFTPAMSSSPSSRLSGAPGEEAALRFLLRKGYRLVERNVRSRWGEIDLVCRKGSTLVFIEVKSRRSLSAGHPLEALTPTKQMRLRRATSLYMMRSGHPEAAYRIDLIAVILSSDGRVEEITHLENAVEGE